MNIDQARKKGNQRLVSMFFKRLATNSEQGIYHGIIAYANK